VSEMNNKSIQGGVLDFFEGGLMLAKRAGRKAFLERPNQGGRREKGVAAIAVALLSMAVAGAATISFLLTSAQDTQARDTGQSQALAWADQAVRDFTLTHGRLPCPAQSRNGVEVCGSRAKGWLPLKSLEDFLPDAHADRALSKLDIRYLLNQGAGGAGSASDISALKPTFKPRLESGEAVSGYPDNIVGSMELCAKLIGLQGLLPYVKTELINDVRVSRALPRSWRVLPDLPVSNEAIMPASSMLFGLAVAAPGAPKAASGVNASLGELSFESPLRLRTNEYKDLVRVVKPGAFYESLGCGAAIASLDTLAVAHVWSSVNEGNRTGGLRFIDRIVDITQMAAMADGIALGIQLADLANGFWNVGGNFTKLMQAQLNFFFEFWAIPIHLFGISQAVGGAILTAIDLGMSAGAVAMDLYYLNGYQQAGDRLRSFQVWAGGRDLLRDAHMQGMTATIVESIPGAPSDLAIPPAVVPVPKDGA